MITDRLLARLPCIAVETGEIGLLDRAMTVSPLVVVPQELAADVASRGGTALVRQAHSVTARLPDSEIEIPATSTVIVGSVDEVRESVRRGTPLTIIDLDSCLTTALSGFTEQSAMIAADSPLTVSLTHRDPMVLLAGMLGDVSEWDGFASELADVFQPWPMRIDLDDSVVGMAESVLAGAPDRFVLCGHSLGGIVALEIVRRAPQRVTALVLVSSSAREPDATQQAVWAAWRRRAEQGDFAGIAADLARATLGPQRRGEAALVAANEELARRVGVSGFVRQLCAQHTRCDNLPLLPEITVPTLVVSGELDEICAPPLQQEIVEHCARARLVTLPGCGHMAMLEQPQALADAIRGWHRSTSTAEADQAVVQ